MRDAAIERAAQHRAAGFEHVRAAEILPQAKADRGQIEPAVAAAAIGHPPVIAIGIGGVWRRPGRSEEHTSELQSLMRISYAVFCLKKKKQKKRNENNLRKQKNKI